MLEHLSIVVAGIAIVVNTGGTIWWASKLTANLGSLVEVVKELRADFKQHARDDTEFQIEVTSALGGSRKE